MADIVSIKHFANKSLAVMQVTDTGDAKPYALLLEFVQWSRPDLTRIEAVELVEGFLMENLPYPGAYDAWTFMHDRRLSDEREP
jgi:hypothetical protein